MSRITFEGLKHKDDAIEKIRDANPDVVLVDMGLEDDRIHSPNEKFEVALFHRGVRLSAELLRALARA